MGRRGLLNLAVWLGCGGWAAAGAPSVDAGSDVVVLLPQSTATLVGSASDDGFISSYQWIQIDGPAASLGGTQSPTLSITGLSPGMYRFRLTATDDEASSAHDDACVFVMDGTSDAVLSGDLRQWHRVSTTFTGPSSAEGASPNPFLDYRLTVFFVHPTSGTSYQVPGFFAADGDAAQTSATAGDQWRAHLCPSQVGNWYYWAQFRQGAGIAIDEDLGAGTPASFDGASGSFQVQASDRVAPDFRSKGKLRFVGKHHLQFEGTGEYFVKGGVDSPENLLAYYEFDATTPTHQYSPHAADFAAFGGGPTWQNGKGRNLIGGLNYLSSKGVNSLYFLTLTANGDGDDVWPWITPTQKLHYDVSKLAQWEIVLGHMDTRGIMAHVVTQETENDQLLDGGALGVQRKLYYRELIARFAHHLAITWNLGEENSNTAAQVTEFFAYVTRMDPYGSNVVIHTFPGEKDDVYYPQLAARSLCGTSLQMASMSYTHQETQLWVDESTARGTPWVVCLDEIGPAGDGVLPDSVDPTHDGPRHHALWGNLMAGGGGVEWYFGYRYANNDIDCEDWRSRERMYEQTRHALDFFAQIPFWEMQHADHLVSGSANFGFAKPNEVYAAYLPNASNHFTMNVGSGDYGARWFDPRNGGFSQGSVTTVTGPGPVSMGAPPNQPSKDWAVLLEKVVIAPAITDVTITPTPFTQPADMQIDVVVENSALVGGVRMMFWGPNGAYAGWTSLQEVAPGEFRRSFDHLSGLPPGSWSVVALVWDRSSTIVSTARRNLIVE
jgi:hypothetical protein